VVGGELAGRLWVTGPPAEPEPVQLRVIERFTLVVALLLLQQRHLLDVQSRLSGDLLGDLLREGGPVRPRAVLDRAAALGHDLSRPHLVHAGIDRGFGILPGFFLLFVAAHGLREIPELAAVRQRLL